MKTRSPVPNQNRLGKAIASFSGTVLLTSVVVAGCVVLLRHLGGLEDAELNAYDTLMRQRPVESVDDRLLVVGVTENDIQSRKEYPLQDITLAVLLQKLEEYQPRAIGIDIARDVPQDSIQWEALSQELQQLINNTRGFIQQGAGKEALQQQLTQLEAYLNQGSGRQALLQVLANNDTIFVPCALSSAIEPGVSPPPGVPPERVGFAELPQDPSGVVRRSLLISTPAASPFAPITPSICSEVDPNNQVLSLSFQLALLYLDNEGIVAEQDSTDNIRLGSTVLQRLSADGAAGYKSSQIENYQIMLNYRAPDNIRQVSLTQVLEGDVDPEWIKDRLILIGYTSTIAKDVFTTPFNAGTDDEQPMPGVMVHAHGVSQILSAVLDGRPLIWYWSPAGELLWIVGWTLVGGMLAWFIRRTWLFVLTIALAGGGLYYACYWFFLQGGWVPLVPSAIALGTGAISVILVDRANKSGYALAFYEQVRDQVKTVITPKIEIDQEKRAKQVAEITESGYFQDLVQRAKAIREKRATES